MSFVTNSSKFMPSNKFVYLKILAFAKIIPTVHREWEHMKMKLHGVHPVKYDVSFIDFA